MTAPNPKITQEQALNILWPYGLCLGYSPSAVLAKVCEVPEKVALRKIEGLIDKGLADCGVSPTYAWRTEEGEKRLEELREARKEKDETI